MNRLLAPKELTDNWTPASYLDESEFADDELDGDIILFGEGSDLEDDDFDEDEDDYDDWDDEDDWEDDDWEDDYEDDLDDEDDDF
jgi:hypothetical protein